MPPDVRARLVRVVAWSEQEVRAHPRLYIAFYGAINRSPRLRDVAGRLRLRVRGRAGGAGVSRPVDPTRAADRVRRATAVRLGLPVDGS
jgi:hypothetical protein